MSLGGGSSGGSEPSKIVRFCDAVIIWTLLVLVVGIPIFFLPWTIEVLELNKQLLLLVGAGIAGIAWLGKMLVERKFEYRRSVVNSIVVLYLAVYALSAWFSDSRYMSVVGDFGQEMSGFFSVFAMVLLYFVTVSNVRTVRQLNRLMSAFVLSGFVVAVYALLQGLGAFVLPFEFTRTTSFNTVGTVAAMGIYLSFIVTLIGGMLLVGHTQTAGKRKRELAWKVFMVATASVSLLLIAVIDFRPINIALFVASGVLIGFAFLHARQLKGISGVLLPIVAIIVSVLLMMFRFPVSLGYPAEVMPSMKASWEITMQTLRESPMLGSGPGTFILDYAKHRSPDVNATQFWNIRFDRGASHFLTSLATTGLLGTLSWLAVALFLLAAAVRKLMKANEETWHVLVGMFAAWFLLVVSKFLYSSTLSLEFAFWMVMALLVIVHRRDFFSIKFENSPRAAMTLSFVFILSLVLAVSGLFVEGQRYAAEIHYANAIRADRAGGEADDVLAALTRAANLNQSNDVYVRNLALGLLVKANDEFVKPVELERAEEESDEDYNARMQDAQQQQFRNATALTANSVNTAKLATQINDANIANWSVLASIYQSLMGVSKGADIWAVDSYMKAIELEPSNPSFHTELGKVYVFQADLAARGLQSEDGEVKANAQEQVDEFLQKAIDSFNKAIELKADFGAAHYNMALTLDRQGKLTEAIAKMEAVVSLNPQDVGVGFQLALLYFRNDQKAAAARLMESVVRLSPDFSNARWYLAAMYEDGGDMDAAIAQIKEVEKLNPDNELVTRKLAELEAETLPPAEGEEPAEDEGDLPLPVNQSVENPNEPGL